MRHLGLLRSAFAATRRATRWLPSSFLVRTALFLLLALLISGLAHAMAQPAHEELDEAAEMAKSLAVGRASPEDVPTDFATVMGYEPAVLSGTLVKPDGGCSTPGGLGPERFTTACRVHDLGYDVLRYAERDGSRLAAAVRFELDRRLFADLLESCDTGSCRVTAMAYFGAVSANSARQGYKAPHAEPALPWASLVVGVLGLGGLTGVAVDRDGPAERQRGAHQERARVRRRGRHRLGAGMSEGDSDSGTVVGRFLDRSAKRGSQPLWYRRLEHRWVPVSWNQARDEVVRLAAGLASLGIAPGERVGLMGPNLPDWVIGDYAIQHVGGVVVPLYANSPPEQIDHVLAKTKARVCLVYGDEALGSVRESELAGVDTVVVLHWSDQEQGIFVGRDNLLGRGENWAKKNPRGLTDRLAAVLPDAAVTVILTSGTGDEPKGVVLSHRNLLWAAEASVRAVGAGAREKTLSFLPLAHAFERVVTTVVPLAPTSKHWTVWFVEDMKDLPAALRTVRPTLFVAVPVVWQRMQTRIQTEMARMWIGRRILARVTLALGGVSAKHRQQGWTVLPKTRLAGASARILGRRVLNKVGLGRCWFAVSGAAPLPATTQFFFQALGLPLQQGWGLTETAALCTIQEHDDLELGVVGRPLEGVELRLGNENEVLVRGPNLFLGYEGEQELAAPLLDTNGFMHTGDIGRLTEDGRLMIIDRLNDVIITSGGRSVAPQEIEANLASDPLIDGTMVFGDGRDYIVALLSLNGREAANLAGADRRDDEGLWEHPRVRQHVERTVAAVNRTLHEGAQVRRFAILPFGFPDEALTPSMKLKRRVVEAVFEDLIESLYV